MRHLMRLKFCLPSPAMCKDVGPLAGGRRRTGWRGRVAPPHRKGNSAPWVVLLSAVWILVLLFVPLESILAWILMTILLVAYFR